MVTVSAERDMLDKIDDIDFRRHITNSYGKNPKIKQYKFSKSKTKRRRIRNRKYY